MIVGSLPPAARRGLRVALGAAVLAGSARAQRDLPAVPVTLDSRPPAARRGLRVALGAALLAGSARAQCDLPAVSVTLDAAPPAFVAVGHALDADGARLASGAPHEQVLAGTDPAPFHGAVWVHRLEDGALVEEAKLRGHAFQNGDHFGWDVAIDGPTLFVGAPGPCVLDCLPGLAPGEVVVHELGPGGWTQVLRTTSSDATPSQAFGRAVAVDGEVAVVGATGRAYVLERAAGAWRETAALDAPSGANFGRAVAVTADLVAVSAPSWPLGPGDLAGEVHVFERAGAAWTHVATIEPPADAHARLFGWSIALSGERLAVGAPRTSYGDPLSGLSALEPGTLESGAVFVYDRDAAGDFVLVARLGEAEPVATGELGASVALDGDLLAAGAPRASRAHLFERTALGWAERATFAAPSPHDELGRAVTLADGLLAAGAPGTDAAAIDTGLLGATTLAALSCPTPRLLGTPTFLPAPTGGPHVLALDAGPAHANALYLVAGSLSGTTPGTPFGPVLVPLNLDAYALASITGAGTDPFLQTVGILDPDGHADAALAVPPSLAVATTGLEAHHAAIVLTPLGPDLATAPTRLRLLP